MPAAPPSMMSPCRSARPCRAVCLDRHVLEPHCPRPLRTCRDRGDTSRHTLFLSQPRLSAHNLLKRSEDRGWGTTVKWLSGLSLCVCVRACFVCCPQVRPPLPTESTSQIVPTGPRAPPSRAHTDADAFAPNRITPQIQKPLQQREDQMQKMQKVTPQDDPTRMCAT